MPFFDFHCHPAFKNLLAPAGSTLTPWDDIKVKLFVGKIVWPRNIHWGQSIVQWSI